MSNFIYYTTLLHEVALPPNDELPVWYKIFDIAIKELS